MFFTSEKIFLFMVNILIRGQMKVWDLHLTP